MPRQRTNFQVQALYVSSSPSTGTMFAYGATGVPSTVYPEVTGYLNNTSINAAQFQAATTTGIYQLYRIQSAGYNYGVSRTPVQQFGQLEAIDQIIMSSPVASANFNYILSNFYNEHRLGLVVNNSVGALSGILNQTSDDKNYFLLTDPEGSDAVGNSESNSNVAVMGVGNAYMTSYSFQASVNNFPTVSVNVEGLNLSWQQTRSGVTPALNPENGRAWSVVAAANGNTIPFRYILPSASQDVGTGNLAISALRPGDITVTILKRDAEGEGDLSNATGPFDLPGATLSDAKIQSCSLSFDLSRETISELGSRFAISRMPAFPVTVSASVDAIVGDLTTGNLSDLINCDDAYDITIKLNRPNTCTDFSNVLIAQYNVRNAKINSISYNDAIGSNRTVSFGFSSTIGGPNTTTAGLWMSGIYNTQI